MKNLKIALASMLLVASVIGFSAFKSHTYNKKAFAITCFYYNGPNQSATEIGKASNWNTTASIPPIGEEDFCSSGIDLCAICFDNVYLNGGKPIAQILAAVNQTTFALTVSSTGFRNTATISPGVTTPVDIYLKPAL